MGLVVASGTVTEQFGLAKQLDARPTEWMQLSLQTLERAVSVRRKIEQLEKLLSSIFEESTPTQVRRGLKRRMSAAARAKISAAAKARWAKRRGTVATRRPKKQTQSRGLTPAGRRKLSQLMKARWAARKRGVNV
jgi:hypothetical protein